MANILNVISVCGKTGGTTVKLKKLTEESQHTHFVYFALYDKQIIRDYPQNKVWFSEKSNIKTFDGLFGRNILRHSIEIYRIARMNNIDIIHFYFNFENTFAPFLKLLYPKAIQVRSIVGYDEPLSFARSFLLSKVLKPIDNVIHISNYIKILYEHDYPILKKKNNLVIYNAGIHISNIISELATRKHLVSVSGLCARKNLGVLIKAMNIVVHEHKIDVKLYILGDGPSRKELHDLILELQLTENVILVGYTTDTVSYLNNCMIYVHPAHTEGFGIAVTEAMYMKCPTIVSNAGALPELVVDGVTGYIVDPYNPIEWSKQIVKLLLDQDLRYKMAEASHKRALDVFPVNSFVNNHDKFYDLILSNNP